MRDILSVRDFTGKDVEEIFKGADRMLSAKNGKSKKIILTPFLAKVTLAFFEPSTRTLGSFEEAARLLRFDRQIISGSEGTSLVKNESIADTVRMLGKGNQGADILVMRTKIEGAPRFASEILSRMNYETVVINGGDGKNQHPTQALLDFWAIKNCVSFYNSGFKNFSDLTIGFVNDLETSRVVHSDLEMAKLLGVNKIRLVSVPEVGVQDQYKKGFDDTN
jgi:aspartate carbamoyltransferase catalytic subunit